MDNNFINSFKQLLGESINNKASKKQLIDKNYYQSKEYFKDKYSNIDDYYCEMLEIQHRQDLHPNKEYSIKQLNEREREFYNKLISEYEEREQENLDYKEELPENLLLPIEN